MNSPRTFLIAALATLAFAPSAQACSTVSSSISTDPSHVSTMTCDDGPQPMVISDPAHAFEDAPEPMVISDPPSAFDHRDEPSEATVAAPVSPTDETAPAPEADVAQVAGNEPILAAPAASSTSPTPRLTRPASPLRATLSVKSPIVRRGQRTALRLRVVGKATRACITLPTYLRPVSVRSARKKGRSYCFALTPSARVQTRTMMVQVSYAAPRGMMRLTAKVGGAGAVATAAASLRIV